MAGNRDKFKLEGLLTIRKCLTGGGSFRQLKHGWARKRASTQPRCSKETLRRRTERVREYFETNMECSRQWANE
eukprot:1179704-Prorocentrum_minimum.AAC.2